MNLNETRAFRANSRRELNSYILNMKSIRKNDDFRRCYREGRSRADKFLVLYHVGNGTDESRIGISVSKRVGNSVVRHRIKRLVKENYRLHESEFSSGLDYVVVARRSADGASYHQIETSLLTLMKKSGCYVAAMQREQKNPAG